MFCAHLDTVPHQGEVEVIFENGVFRSAGETILGADNKAAVTVLMELAARHAQRPGRGGAGAGVHDRRGGRSARGEGARPRGAALALRLRPRPRLADRRGDHGRAHLQASPGRVRGGRGPLGHPPRGRAQRDPAAAAAIHAMDARPPGRRDDRERRDRSSGGTASNVVPGRCTVDGEARSIDDDRASDTVGGDGRRLHLGRDRARVSTWTWTCARCSAATGSPPARRRSRWRRRRSSAAATSRSRRRPAAAATPTRWSPRGFDCVLLANGTEANHTPDESVAAERIVEMLAVCEAVAELVGRC